MIPHVVPSRRGQTHELAMRGAPPMHAIQRPALSLQRSVFPLAVLGLILLLGAACGTAVATPQPQRLTLAASSSALPLAEELAAGYHAAFPHINVDLLPLANEAAATQATLTGQADAALISGAAPVQDGLQASHVANDALALIVHPSRALDDLPSPQVQEILRGLVRSWEELGAGQGAIQVVTREEGAGPRQVAVDAFLDARPMTPTALVLPDDRQVRARVAADPQALALLPAAWLDDQVRALSIDGRGPEWVAAGWPDYPAELPIHFLTPTTPAPEVGALFDFMTSPRGQRIISRHYAPIQP